MADDKGKNVADATAGAEDEDGEDEIRLRPRKAPVAPLVLKPAELLKSVGEALDALRAKRPLVSCLTNSLTALRVADGLLAAGASPIAALDSGEATVLATTCDALLVNVGTADRVQAEAMRAAVARANMSSHPWALDPAGVGSLSLRTYLAKELMRRFPAVIRGNASEILVLAGVVGAEAGGRGLESTAKGEDVVREASRLAQVTHATVIVSGEKDFVCAENAPVVANALVYTGDAQPLVTAEGEWLYSLDGENFTADIPAAVNAGVYTVYYKAAEDAEAQSVVVTVDKADVVFTPPVPAFGI